MKLKVLAASAVLALTALTALTTAHAQTLKGCYVPQSGFANSQSIPVDPGDSLEQIGSYRIVLVNKDAPLRERRLVLSGPFKGKSDPATGGLVLDHVLGDLNLEGLILTKGDVATVTGITYTEEGEPKTVDVIEDLNPVAGTGKFSGLRLTGNSITVTGTLDLATGTNTFDVVSGEGQVCFE